MNNSLAPTYLKNFGEHWVLWYRNSNSYSIVESSFKNLLDDYLQAETIDEFKAELSKDEYDLNFDDVVKNINNYLIESNKSTDSISLKQIPLNKTNRNITKYYNVNGQTIKICYDSELVLKTIDPALSYLSVASTEHINVSFDIYLQDDFLFLYKDEKLITYVPKRDYHLLQGKFIMSLFCSIHNKQEADWIATFHGSTITDGSSSILFIGESGKGKSTLCTLLTASGFDLVADDVSPMLSEDKDIYYNPSAISIKRGSFTVLESIVDKFKDLEIIQFNKTKGQLKYVPCHQPHKMHYSCKAIISVNYNDESETLLELVPTKTILETLVPESWLSPNPLHAEQFLDWLDNVETYKLTYSDTESVTAKVSELFNQLNKNF